MLQVTHVNGSIAMLVFCHDVNLIGRAMGIYLDVSCRAIDGLKLI